MKGISSIIDVGEVYKGYGSEQGSKKGRRNVDTGGLGSLMDVDEGRIRRVNNGYKIGYGYLDGDNIRFVCLKDFSHEKKNIYVCGKDRMPSAVFTGDSMVLPASKCDEEFIRSNMCRLVVFKSGMSDYTAGRFSGCRFIILNCEDCIHEKDTEF